jgi:hypothetical protein
MSDQEMIGAYDSFYFLAVRYENLNSPLWILLVVGSPCFPLQKCHVFSSKMKPVVHKRSEFVLFEFMFAL